MFSTLSDTIINKFELPDITHVHTTKREHISIDEELSKTVIPDMMKHILKDVRGHR